MGFIILYLCSRILSVSAWDSLCLQLFLQTFIIKGWDYSGEHQPIGRDFVPSSIATTSLSLQIFLLRSGVYFYISAAYILVLALLVYHKGGISLCLCGSLYLTILVPANFILFYLWARISYYSDGISFVWVGGDMTLI